PSPQEAVTAERPKRPACQLPSGEHRRLGYCVGLTCGGARLAARSSAMICCRKASRRSQTHLKPADRGALPPRQPAQTRGRCCCGCRNCRQHRRRSKKLGFTLASDKEERGRV